MFTNLTKWYYPTTIEEALALLKKGEVVPHAGGTGLLRVGNNRLRGLVELGRLPIHYLTEDGDFFSIGAGVTLAQIASWEKLEGAAAVLKEAAGQIASTALRNRITIGGSLADLPPWSDLPSVLLALDASIEIKGTAAGEYHIEQYLQQLPLDGTSLITAIKIPRLPGMAAFQRVTKTKFDYSMLDIAVYLDVEEDKIKDVRVAIGCAVSRATRLKKVEDFLLKKPPSLEIFTKAAELIDFKPIEDKRASRGFRKELSQVLLPRLLQKIMKKILT